MDIRAFLFEDRPWNAVAKSDATTKLMRIAQMMKPLSEADVERMVRLSHANKQVLQLAKGSLRCTYSLGEGGELVRRYEHPDFVVLLIGTDLREISGSLEAFYRCFTDRPHTQELYALKEEARRIGHA